jgi:nucleoside-diphosphate-sugar epimerase
MKVIVAGATGALGTALVPKLRDAGHDVVGLTRSESGARRLWDAGVMSVQADLLDGPGLLAALEGCRADAVVHQATALTRTPMRHRHLYPTNELRDRGTTHLLRAASLVGARRFVTQSFFLGYGYRDHGDVELDESAPFAQQAPGVFNRHMTSMRSNEEQVFGTPGIEGISLRYGLFYGADTSTGKLLDLVRRRQLPVTEPTGVTSPIHLDDAAAATVAALEHGRAGEAYNVVDDHPVSFDEYVRTLAAAAGAPAPRRVPAWVLRSMPYLYALMVGTRIRVSNAKAKAELGWAPRYPSCHEGFTALVRAGRG